jgi:large subunit ribosomal protein L23
MSIFSKKNKDEKEESKKEVAEVKVAKKEEKAGVIANREQKENKERKFGHMSVHQILIRPLVTEKGGFIGAENKYLFEVSPRTNKSEVRKAIEHAYGVKPLKVNVINVKGKTTRSGRSVGRLKNWKKAVVTLKSGDKISIYEGV